MKTNVKLHAGTMFLGQETLFGAPFGSAGGVNSALKCLRLVEKTSPKINICKAM